MFKLNGNQVRTLSLAILGVSVVWWLLDFFAFDAGSGTILRSSITIVVAIASLLFFFAVLLFPMAKKLKLIEVSILYLLMVFNLANLFDYFYTKTGHLNLEEGKSSNVFYADQFYLNIQNLDNGTFETLPLDFSNASNTTDSIESANKALKSPFSLVQYVGEAAVSTGSNTPVEVTLGIKNDMFNEQITISSASPEAQLGPMLFVLKQGDESSSSAGAVQGTGQLIVYDATTTKPIKSLSVGDLKNGLVTVNGVDLELLHVYEHATVVDNKIVEGGEKGKNPAIELRLKKGEEEFREISYAKHEGFSLHDNPPFNLAFKYELNADKPSQSYSFTQSNVVLVTPISSDEFYVELLKNNTPILQDTLTKFDSIATPWMNMQLSLESASGSVGEMAADTSGSRGVLRLKTSSLQERQQEFNLNEGGSLEIATTNARYILNLSRLSYSLPFFLLQKNSQIIFSQESGWKTVDSGLFDFFSATKVNALAGIENQSMVYVEQSTFFHLKVALLALGVLVIIGIRFGFLETSK